MLQRTPALSLAVCLAAAAWSSPAIGGSLDDFRDSIEREPNADDRQGGTGGEDRGGVNVDGGEACEPDDGVGACIMSQLLATLFGARRRGEEFPGGDTPVDGRGRARFSWGDTPYDGRGRNVAPSVANLDAGHVTVTAAPRRPGHFRGRAEVLALADGSAIGAGGFVLVEGARAPGLALWHQQLMDFGASDRLGVTTLTLEPRIVTGAAAVVSWNIGGILYGSENGFVNGGMQLGLGMALTPVRPLALEARLAAHVMPDAMVGDIYFGLGVEVRPGIFATAGYRTLIGPDFPLRAVVAGVQFDLGFGGGRRVDALASR